MASKLLLAIPQYRYLSAWFCPYAHRATIALEHHAGRVGYEWVEALGWKLQHSNAATSSIVNSSSSSSGGTSREDQEKSDAPEQTKEWYYHWKADELKRVNPSALVPTLIPMVTDSSKANGQTVVDESKAVYESLVVVDYIDMVSNATGSDRLVPREDDPYQTARCRIWADKVNRECCSPYYGVLVRTDDAERREHFAQLLAGLTNFARELKTTPGPTFLPHAQLSSVDIALIPWAYRYYVLEHYRGPSFAIPRDDSNLQPYFEWYDHVMALESVKRTLPDRDRYLDHIQKYADGSARSKVANAVRRGVAAHELDDDKDEY